jgi:hypothetical protein
LRIILSLGNCFFLSRYFVQLAPGLGIRRCSTLGLCAVLQRPERTSFMSVTMPASFEFEGGVANCRTQRIKCRSRHLFDSRRCLLRSPGTVWRLRVILQRQSKEPRIVLAAIPQRREGRNQFLP